MVDTDQQAVAEIVHEGEALGTRELVDILERYHDDRPGIPLDAVDAYGRALNEREDSAFDTDAVRGAIEEQLTASESWVADGPRFYELDDGRVSQYPVTWHDRLGGERDPAAYIRFFQEQAPSVLTAGTADRQGIYEDQLVDVVAVVGRMSRESAKTAIESARDDDRLVEDADQHPKAGVYLAK